MTLSATAVAPQSALRPDYRPPAVTTGRLTFEADSLEPVVAHGYTVSDIDALARKAARVSRWAKPYGRSGDGIAAATTAHNRRRTVKAEATP